MSALTINSEQITGLTTEHLHWFTPKLGVNRQLVSPWLAMKDAALKDGIELAIASGFRSFERQLSIWNKKFSGNLTVLDISEQPVNLEILNELELVEAIMLFSALPGGSRHHWGTDIDVYAPNLLPAHYQLKLEASEYQKDGYLYPLHQWLKANAAEYGFSFVYQHYQGGVAAEPWHLSYLPQAICYEKQISCELLTRTIAGADILGKQVLLEHIEMLYNRFISSVFQPQEE